MNLFILSIILLVLFVIGIYNLLSFLSRLEQVIALFLIITAYLVLTLEVAGLFKVLDKRGAILAIQSLFFCLVLILNFSLKIGFPGFYIKTKMISLKDLITRLNNNRGLFLYGGLISVVYIFLLYLEVRFPQNTTDSLYNHLSRIGYWLQQGSLSTYDGFNNYGTSYPYNNSLLMIWSVIFLRSDILVGLVQYFSVIALVISIYLTGTELGLSRKGSAFAALMTGTFPIILFESITAQNDILISAYLVIAFYFLLKILNSLNKKSLILSLLAFALAIGTKQYALFALPGYAALMVLVFVRNRSAWNSFLKIGLIGTLVFSLLFGAYAYIQNWIKFTTPAGIIALFQDNEPVSRRAALKKIAVNSARLSYQFLTCEGLPPEHEQTCIQYKASLLRPVLTSSRINLESPDYLLESDNPFNLDTRYPLNEESSWYGVHGWLIIIPTIPLGAFYSVKKRKLEVIILFVTSFVFFLITASFKPGWDPYVGRYLIFAIALIMPFSALVFQSNLIVARILTFFLCIFSLSSMFYCIANNDLRPLVSKRMLYRTSNWGKENSLLVHKLSDRLEPLTRNIQDVWSMDDIEIQMITNQTFEPVIRMLDRIPASGSVLLVLAKPGNIPDYLFFGISFDRLVIPVTSLDQFISRIDDNYYLLISSDYSYPETERDTLLAAESGWRLFIHK